MNASLRAVSLTLAVAAVGGGLFWTAGRFARHEIAAVEERRNQPTVTNTRPADRATAVALTASLVAEVHLPNLGQGVDATKLAGDAVKLVRRRDGVTVDTHVNTTGSGDAIILVPRQPLESSTDYDFVVTENVTDTGGHRFAPHTTRFTTAAGQTSQEFPVAFERVELPVSIERSAFTAITFGPDGKLYAGTYDGRILRYAVSADGTLTADGVFPVLLQANRGPRLITGLRFAPTKPSTLYISHGQMKLQDADDWTGSISCITDIDRKTPTPADYRDLVVHLPRAYKDHLNFQMDLGPDGCLYFNQGSMTGVGEPDLKWGLRGEHLMTAAILKLDPTMIGPTALDARTDGDHPYDPAAKGAPLTIVATGVRSGYDMLWHSNGSLYTSVNGAAAGGNTPAVPARDDRRAIGSLHDVQTTTDDVLLRIQPGRYYGHPNPARGEFVANGGNPTRGVDTQEIPQYPAGTEPEPTYSAPAYVYGKNFSPNGMVEYTSDALGPAARGAIFVARYSAGDDIVMLVPNADGSIRQVVVGIDGCGGFTDPLDLALDPRSGNLYVAEFGGQKLTLLRPRPGVTSRQVFIEHVTPSSTALAGEASAGR